MEGSICFVSTKGSVVPCTLEGIKTKPKKPQAVRRPGFSTTDWNETFVRNYLLPHLPANSGC